MGQPSTPSGSSKLSPALAQLILRTHGASSEIARLAGFGRAYAYKVLHGLKPPSRRFLLSIAPALARRGVGLAAAQLSTVELPALGGAPRVEGQGSPPVIGSRANQHER